MVSVVLSDAPSAETAMALLPRICMVSDTKRHGPIRCVATVSPLIVSTGVADDE